MVEPPHGRPSSLAARAALVVSLGEITQAVGVSLAGGGLRTKNSSVT